MCCYETREVRVRSMTIKQQVTRRTSGGSYYSSTAHSAFSISQAIHTIQSFAASTSIHQRFTLILASMLQELQERK